MDDGAVTTTDVEEFLNFMELVATITAEGFVRWVFVRADPERRIVAETIYPMFAHTWVGTYSKARVEEESPELLDAWAGVDHRFFTAITSDQEIFVHTAAAPEPWVVERIKDLLDLSMKGDAPDRTRAQQLADSDLARALERWELGDDSVMSERAIESARSRLAFVAERRAKLRWGMLSIGAPTVEPST